MLLLNINQLCFRVLRNGINVVYERRAIEAWVRAHGTSSFTRERLALRDLVPEEAIKADIDRRLAYYQEHYVIVWLKLH